MHFPVSWVLEQCLARRHTRRWLWGHSRRAGGASVASFLPRLCCPGSLSRTQFTRKTNSEKFTKHLDFHLLLEMPGYLLFPADFLASPLTSQILNSSPTFVAFFPELNSIQQVLIVARWVMLGAGRVMTNTAEFLPSVASESDVRADKQAHEQRELAQVANFCAFSSGGGIQLSWFTSTGVTVPHGTLNKLLSLFVLVSLSVYGHDNGIIWCILCMYMCIYLILYILWYLDPCVYVYTCIHMYIYCRLYMDINIYLYICMHTECATVYMCVYIYILHILYMCVILYVG